MSALAPRSRLTAQNPDLWHRAVTEATRLTGYVYAPKIEYGLCGGGPYYTPQQRQIRDAVVPEIWDINKKIDEANKTERELGESGELTDEKALELILQRKALRKKLAELREKIKFSPVVEVPDGAMEWLLHEVGHWVAATHTERWLPNYGFTPERGVGTGARELQAWAFEDIVLAPWGRAYDFIAPPHRGGVVYERDIRPDHFRHIDRRLNALDGQIDLHLWRSIYGEWVAWGRRQPSDHRPWEALE